MKAVSTIFFAVSGLLAIALANPVPGEPAKLARRTLDFDNVISRVESHTDAVLAICADADVDIDAAIDVRAKVAAKLRADLEAVAAILADATAEIKASAKADILAGNKGCNSKCVEKKVVDHSKKFCKSVDVVVKKLGEDCVKPYVKPVMVSFGKFTSCLDGIFVGIAASVGAVVKSILGVSLSLGLGLDLDLDLGLGAILGLGRV